jgi:hypothetical protein
MPTDDTLIFIACCELSGLNSIIALKLKDHLLPGKSGQLPRFLWPGNMVKQGNIKTSISIAKDRSYHGSCPW